MDPRNDCTGSMHHRPLEKLAVVGVRYRRTTYDPADERGLDAYAAADVYTSAGVPVVVHEPRIAAEELSGDAVKDLGRFNGKIAATVAAGRRSGAVVLMTGGDCSHATGVVGGLQDAHGPKLRLGLVWFDAHGDFNTPETSLSGSLGGMPVAVCAGLAYPGWRDGSHIETPLPPDHIVLVGTRNLDESEARLIQTAGVAIASPALGFPGERLETAVERLSQQCDAIYLHLDADFLDRSLVPSHGNREANGPTMSQAIAAVQAVMATGKVIALALVSIYNSGPKAAISIQSGIDWLTSGLQSWRCHGTTRCRGTMNRTS